MRVSEAALGLITRVNHREETEYLIQWNDNWQAYSLIGGHREDGESFRDCCVRETVEELECRDDDVNVSRYPHVTLRFREYSHAAQFETDYQWQVFRVLVSDTVLNRLPESCGWASRDLIRARHAGDGKPIANQIERVMKGLDEAEFDLFVSYGHADNDNGSVTALVEHIRHEHEKVSPTEPLKIFFDLWGIRNGDEWERRIRRGLCESKSMLAILSPTYFQSEWCQREYDTFVEHQLQRLYPGESIHAVYVQQHADFETPDGHSKQHWYVGLKKRQFLDARPWWPDGQAALARSDVAKRLAELRTAIWDRVNDVHAINQSPTNLTTFNLNFVGREDELTNLWNSLRLDHVIAIHAIQGIGGLGKTALARAYAHTHRRDYPGGQFEIEMERVSDSDRLKFEIVRLANRKLNAKIPDELINTNLHDAFKDAKAAFERPNQGRILLILDNIACEGIISDRASVLPSPNAVHVLATTRLDPERWGLKTLRLGSLSIATALDLFLKYRPFVIPDGEEPQWHRVRSNSETIAEADVDDDGWKAAAAIVGRLGCHALAVEVVAVYLGAKRGITLKGYLNGLIENGLSLRLLQAGDDPGVRARLSDAIETNIAKLLEPTFAWLESDNPLAMGALEWASLMPPDHIPWSWLRHLLLTDHPEAFVHNEYDPDPWQDCVVPALQGMRLLVGDENDPTARIHRIVQAAITARSALQPASNATSPTQKPAASRLMKFLTSRGEFLKAHWGKPNVNWELRPLHSAGQISLEKKEIDAGVLIDRLTSPLCLDGQLLPACKIQTDLIALYEERLKESQEDHTLLRNLSICYGTLGDIHSSLGNAEQSFAFYDKAVKVSEQLAAIDPENLDYARNSSVSYELIGDFLRSHGNGVDAREFYKKAFTVRNELATTFPKSAEYASDLAYALMKMGDVSLDEGEDVQAGDFYQSALDIRMTLSREDPDNPDYAKEESLSYERIGDVHRSWGNVQKEREFREKALDAIEGTAGKFPDNAEYNRQFAVSCIKMADHFHKLSHWKEAHDFYQKALRIRQGLAQKANANSFYSKDLSVAYQRLGDVFRDQDDREQALHFYEQALAAIEGTAQKTPENATYKQQLCCVYHRIGDNCRHTGDRRQALDFYLKALQAIVVVAQRNPQNAEYARDLAVSYIKIGDLLTDLNNRDKARSAFERAVQSIEEPAKRVPKNANYAHVLFVSYRRMAKIDIDDCATDNARHWLNLCDSLVRRMRDGGVPVLPEDIEFLDEYKRNLEIMLLNDVFQGLGVEFIDERDQNRKTNE